MKIDDFKMRQAFDSSDWESAISIIIEHFKIDADPSDFVLEEHKHTTYGLEISITDNYSRYFWSEDGSFFQKKIKRKLRRQAVIWNRFLN